MTNPVWKTSNKYKIYLVISGHIGSNTRLRPLYAEFRMVPHNFPALKRRVVVPSTEEGYQDEYRTNTLLGVTEGATIAQAWKNAQNLHSELKYEVSRRLRSKRFMPRFNTLSIGSHFLAGQ